MMLQILALEGISVYDSKVETFELFNHPFYNNTATCIIHNLLYLV
jgi:hypothetical protein